LLAVIFDLFGTLVPAVVDQEYRRNHAQMACALGIPEDAFRQCWRGLSDERGQGAFSSTEATLAHVCRTLGVTVTAPQLTLATELKVALTRRTLVPRGGALETLEALRQKGVLIGLISDC
jgi:FMN phosphatase YigB (HAD superfamily)